SYVVVMLSCFYSFRQRGSDNIGQELRWVEPDFSSLVEKERGGKHSGGGIRIIEEYGSFRRNKPIYSRINIAMQYLEKSAAFFSDTVNNLRCGIDRRDFSAHAWQVFRPVIEDFFSF